MIQQRLHESWALLEVTFPLFRPDVLPTIKEARDGRFGPLRGELLEDFENCITKLRADVKLNALKRQHAKINDLESSSAERLFSGLMKVLGAMESLVDDEILADDGVALTAPPKASQIKALDDHLSSDFPKLLALKEMLSKSGDQSSSASVPPSHILDQIVGLIEFPRSPSVVEDFQRSLESFNNILTNMFEKVIGQWKSEAQTQYFTESDVAAIENPSDGEGNNGAIEAVTEQSTVNNSDIDNDPVCHKAKWIAASFTSPLKEDDAVQSPSLPCQICHSPLCYTSDLYTSPFETSSPQVLALSPSGKGHGALPSPSIGSFRISDLLSYSLATKSLKQVGLMHRKLLGVLLASTLFQMCSSSWTHRLWRRDLIYLHQYPKNFRRLEQLRLRIPCIQQDVATATLKEPNTESIAAFGVLLLELEANDKAEWDEDQDLDFEYDVLSNQVRLGRVLQDWEALVRDEYRAISQACHDFEHLVQTIDHPKIAPGRKRVAVFYKCVFEPLFKLLMRDFSPARKLFEGVSGPWNGLAASFQINSSKVSKRLLYDEQDVPAAETKKIQYAQQFMDGLLRPLQLIPELVGAGHKEKIRIAVLDSGVSLGDPRISRALRTGKIKENKSWLESAEDTHGHGTHVTRLLLHMAPAAEIYVGKICDGKMINEDFIQGIAKAIRWAVEEWKVHVISLSLGFEQRYEAVESAVDLAVAKETLVLAAASNNGALTDRVRPARRSDVLCIHASDGLGNSGDMNPTPKRASYNFSTLGVAVPSSWQRKEVWKSGTSFSTPIAAGFAATILQFVEAVDYSWSIPYREIIYKKRGMEAIFAEMSDHRDGYDFVNLARLWHNRTDQEVAKAIEEILEEL